MIAPVKIEEAQRLLDEGKLSHRQIALAVGVSRSTIGALAAGNRPDYEARQRAREMRFEPLGPRARCPECGGMVYTPCRLCHVRQLKAREQENLQTQRRRARERAIKRLLAVVRRVNDDSRRAEQRNYLAADAVELSDCK